MELMRLSSPDDPRYGAARALYGASFPLHEQRCRASQDALFSEAAYHYDLLADETGFAGLALSWQTDAFTYLEHLCILPERRGQGCGTQALRLLAEHGAPVILEIDPPVDAVSLRRRAFYLRADFQENPYPHAHPPYRTGFSPHPLEVLSSPETLTPEQYGAFYRYLCGVVMHGCPGTE